MSGPPPVPGRPGGSQRPLAPRRRAPRPTTEGPPLPPRHGRPTSLVDGPAPPTAGGPPSNGRPSRPRLPLRPRGRLAMALLAIAAIVLVWLLVSLFQPFSGDGSGRVVVTIPRGSSVSAIGDILARNHVISSSFFFEVRATIDGDRADLKSGTYLFRRDMTYASALATLVKGPAANVVNVTIPEGKSRTEIAQLISPGALRGSYVAATVSSPLLDPRSYGASAPRSLEGFLFPSTYQVKRGADVSALVGKQLVAFKREFATIDLSAARRANLTPYDVLVIASLIEREAEVASERPLIAAVIYNRLRAGMPLGIDASTRFATGNWTQPLTASQLAIASPYNTRTHTGLPPGPIGNPGLASLEAAAHPASTSYLYYVANPCQPGHHSFSSTAAQFNADVTRYNAARAAAGGRAPTGC